MKTISFILSCMMLASNSIAGNVLINNCRTHQCVVNQAVHEVVTVPVNVAFVPSQVLLNGQVTTYGAAQTVTYSYQGPLASDCATCQKPPQGQIPQPPQPGDEVDPNPVNTQSSDLNKRIDRLEVMLDKLLKANGIESPSAEPSAKTVPDAKSELLNQGYDLLTQNCIKCHKPGSAGSFEKLGAKGITMTDAEGNLYRDQDWKRIANSTVGPNATMPKGPNKLDVVNQTLIQRLSE